MKDMKPRRRIIFNGLTVLSLLLCVAIAGLWVRSYWVADGVTLVFSSPTVAMWSQRGRVIIYETSTKQNNPVRYTNTPASISLGFDSEDEYSLYFWRLGGFSASASYRDSFLAVPYWFLTVLFAAPLIVPLRRISQRRKGNLGLCLSCGYDLRATPDRCPECGTVPTKAKA
jgi:hypothetical protein